MIFAPAIIGPTASGKSKFAPAIATAIRGEIISADSGAVYREMNIGTAKPSATLRAQSPHHLVDVCAPDEHFNVGMFCTLAAAAANEIAARKKTPLFVGGAMMYLRALSRGLHFFPEISAAVRQSVRDDLQKLGAAKMHRRLQTIDPQTAKKILPTDSQRISRALELAMQTNKPPSFFIRKKIPPPQLQISFIILMPADRARLRAAIAARLKKMWADGLVAETESIIQKYNLTANSPPLRMAGYRQAAAFLRGEYGEEEMQQRAYYATCQLAKRQMTWLRNWRAPAAAVIDPFAADAEKKITTAARECCIANSRG